MKSQSLKVPFSQLSADVYRTSLQTRWAMLRGTVIGFGMRRPPGRRVDALVLSHLWRGERRRPNTPSSLAKGRSKG